VIQLRSTIDVRPFRSALLAWYRQYGRDLPWRRTRDPYAILVSEVMLQQTQVAAVIPYYYEWLRRFPNIAALARASENEVLHAWQGLGYYNRARHLHAAAKIVQDRHGGVFQREVDAIRELPGVGRYTANAIATFAFDRSVPIVEANTSRLISRLFSITAPIDSSAGGERLWLHAAQLVPRRNAAGFNSALLDLGALVCQPRKPKCGICPVKNFCCATNPEILPRKKARLPLRQLTEIHAFAIRQDKILLEQSRKRWRGMWTLPPLTIKANGTRPLHVSTFPFTHHRVTLRVYRHRPRKIDIITQRWFARAALGSIPIPSPHRRAIEQLMAAA
jgi:A/G-specific adenine glycosylase